MILSSHWLKERYKIIIAMIKELTLFLAIYLIFRNYINFGTYYIFFIIWWILISYIIGRYHAESKNLSQFISKNLFHLIFITFSSIIFLFTKKIINAEKIITTYELLVPLIIILSFIIQSYSDYKNIFKIDKRYNLVFIGKSELFNKFQKEVKRNKFKCNIDYFPTSDDFYKQKISHNTAQIILSQSSINNLESFNRLIMENKKVLKIIDWCEEFLVRYPPSLLTNNDSLDFNIFSKKNKMDVWILYHSFCRLFY